ncbi:putative death-receptor fusion protein-domain-containing protein [Paraphysoderma sedebokerense]|nr:putative death-receptor fusion protein-domain-containing protein [Paraphysoderma sedebokerense]
MLATQLIEIWNFNVYNSPTDCARNILRTLLPWFEISDGSLDRPNMLVDISRGNWTEFPNSVIAICRGMLTNTDKSVLHATIVNGPTSLLEIVFTVASVTIETVSDPGLQLRSFELLVSYLVEVQSDVSLQLPSDNLQKLLHYVWSNFEDPTDSIQNKVRTLFQTLLSLMSEKRENAEGAEFLDRLLQKIMDLDPFKKVKYSMLVLLLPYVGADKILQRDSPVVSQSLKVMSNLSMAPKISAFILAMIRSVDIANLSTARPFLGPICQALTSNDSLLRKHVSSHILLELFKADRRFFGLMLSMLQEKDNYSSINMAYRVQAVIACLKSGRVMGLLEKFSTDSPFFADIDMNLLKSAVSHSSTELRLDVLGLISDAPKASSPISEDEFDIAKEFVIQNMQASVAEFRQRFNAHFTKFLTRVKNSVYVAARVQKSLKKRKALGDAETHEFKISQGRINSAKDFLEWLITVSFNSLFPGATFPRIDNAFKLISLMIDVFGIDRVPPPDGFDPRHGVCPQFPFEVHLGNPRHWMLVMDMLGNPYEIVRVEAFNLLRRFPMPDAESIKSLGDLTLLGLRWISSTRASESDGGGLLLRLLALKSCRTMLTPVVSGEEATADNALPLLRFLNHLMASVREKLEIAKVNLMTAAERHSLHGSLHALSYVFRDIKYNDVRNDKEGYTQAIEVALTLAKETCMTVLEIVANESPEGNIPLEYMEDSDEHVSGDGYGPKHQLILSFGFRAIMGAAELIGTILSTVPLPTDNVSPEDFLTFEQITDVGQLFQTLLTSVRHRGAFSSIHPSFVSFSSRLLTCSNPKLTSLPKGWLIDILDDLTRPEKLNHLVSTRRSAGLPCYVLGLISSDTTRRHFLPIAFEKLMAIAEMDLQQNVNGTVDDLPQVHAFNILRSLYQDSKLSQHVSPYIADGFMLSIKNLSSPIWAIRNCAMMLFSTLINRTCGVKQSKDEHHSINKLTGKQFFHRYPKLHSFLLQELDNNVKGLLNRNDPSVHNSLYPILTLLSRLHPSLFDSTNPAFAMSPFAESVALCSNSSIWNVRVMSARALVPLISSDKLVETCIGILENANLANQNGLHGSLLQMLFLLQGHLSRVANKEVKQALIRFIPPILVKRIHDFLVVNRCNVTRKIFVQIIHYLLFDNTWVDDGVSSLIESQSEDSRQKFESTACAILFEPTNRSPVDVGGFALNVELAVCVLKSGIVYNRFNKDGFTDIIKRLLQHQCYQVVVATLDVLLKYNDSESFDRQALHSFLLGLVLSYNRKDLIKSDSVRTNEILSRLLELLELLNQSTQIIKSTELKSTWQTFLNFFNNRYQYGFGVKVTTLRLLGIILHQVWHSEADLEFKSSSLDIYTSILEEFTHDEQPLPLREASAESLKLISRDIFNLEVTKSVPRNQLTSMVKLIIIIGNRLLQDDDPDVREFAATSLVSGVLAQDCVSSTHAVELCFNHLHRLRATVVFPEVIDGAVHRLFLGNDSLGEVVKCESSPSQVLFAKEDANLYKESMQSVSLAVTYMKKCGSLPSPRMDNVLADIQTLRDFLIQGKTNSAILPFSGFTGVSAVFLALYRIVSLVMLQHQPDKSFNDILKMLVELRPRLHPILQSLIPPSDDTAPINCRIELLCLS